MEDRNPRIKWFVILSIATICLIVSFGFIIHNLNGNKKSEDAYAKMREDNKKKQESSASKNVINVDFSKLTNENSDIFAWIRIPGTNVDYPILMSSDSEPTDYYLNHNIDHSKGYPGCLFVDKFQARDFSNFNTVIYGHNMYTKGTMFHDLTKYYDEDFFAKNKDIEIVTSEKKLRYRVYAAVKFSDDHLLYKYDFTKSIDRTRFLSDLSNVRDVTSHLDKEMKVTSDNRLVTLSTCISRKSNNRYLIVGVQVGEEENKGKE